MLLKKRLLNNAAVAAMQTIISAFLLFFLYRFLLKQLGAEQLGIWAIVLASTSIGRLTDMGLAGAVTKFVANSHAAGDLEKASNFVQTAALTIAGALACLAIISFPILQILLEWVLPKTAIAVAVEILPFAISSLFFGMVSGIFQSGIDACHRMDIRNGLLISCNIFYIVVTVLLVPVYGLKGVAVAQTLQSVLLLLSSWFVLRRLIPTLPIVPFRWSKPIFREMVGYATNFQIGMLAGMFFDPVTKFFLAKYGDLSQTAYYEMANQLLQKARSIVISAQQALVPEIAGSKSNDQQSLTSLYKKTYGLSFLIVLPYYTLIAFCLPVISLFWIGRIEPLFVVYGTFLSIGLFASNLSAVSYFYNIGTGDLIWNTVNHIATAVINVTLALVLGKYFGGLAVVVTAMIALVLPNISLILIVHKRLGWSVLEVVPRIHLKYTAVLIGGVLVAVLTNLCFIDRGIHWTNLAAPALIFLVFILIALAVDSSGRQLMMRIVKRVRPR
jgi:O-antigen/teichoic acid export membrane protein